MSRTNAQRPVEVLRWEQRRTMPWRNGGGTTHEIATCGSSVDFDWRLSVAEVQQSGPFSSFPGVDRIIMLLNGEGMSLALPEGDRELREREPLAFPGEVGVTCTLRDGPTRDLNVMTRRGRYTGEVTVLAQVAGTSIVLGSGQENVLFVLEGELHASGAHAQPLDGVHLVGPGEHHLGGDAVVAVIELRKD